MVQVPPPVPSIPPSCMVQVLLPASELSSQLQSQILLYSSYFRVKDSLHPDHSPHINHISGFFSTQIITFPGFIPDKTTISSFLHQERSPKPAENSIFHICQKITCFDIFHLFCHFLRSTKITHFQKNTKNTIFHYFPLWWQKLKNHCFHQIPQNGQNPEKPGFGQKWENGQNGENGRSAKIPQKWQKWQNTQKWGF